MEKKVIKWKDKISEAIKGIPTPQKIHIFTLEEPWGEIETQAIKQKKLDRKVKPTDLLNIIYTSGSTGKPKGVMSSHQSYVNRILWMKRKFPFAADEVCCQKTSLGFVDHVAEIFQPLLSGIPLVIIPDESVKIPKCYRTSRLCYRKCFYGYFRFASQS